MEIKKIRLWLFNNLSLIKRVGTLASFVVLFLFPSFQITKEIKNNFPITLPSEPLKPGHLFKLHSHKSIFKIFSEKRKLTKISETEYIFGLSRYQKSILRVYGTTQLKSSNLFSHPEDYYFIKYLKVTSNDITRKGNRLRLPASVWSKVNQKDKVSIDHKTLREVFKKEHFFSFDNNFKMPLNSYKVSRFSSPRTLPNGKSYLHSGSDFRAPINTKIVATAPGKVILAQELTVPGKAVVLYHGKDIYSSYFHLNEILALSGNTGRVEGPHLHFEIRWKGIPLAPKETIAFLNSLNLN